MSQNQEIIESKLCAYIDGELDPEGRAEIEKHLEANPQHRRLLESLRATRDLIRWLPREPAPPEISETLNGQLERSVLLEYGGDSLRISRAPRVFAAAAIIALTAGLGAAVYFALPRSQKAAVAFHGTDASKTGASDVVVASPPVPETPSRNDADRSSDLTAKMKSADDATEAPPAAPQSSTVLANREEAGQNGKSFELERLARDVANDPSVLNVAVSDPARNALDPAQSAAPSAVNGAVVMLVRSGTPERAEKQLTSFLNSQQIRWRQAQLATQAPVASAGGQSETSINNPAPVDAMRTRTLQERRELQSQANLQYSAKPGIPDEPKTALAATTQPEATLADKGAGSVPAATQPGFHAGINQVAQQPPVSGANYGANGYRNNGVYVAQMSRRQAAQLTESISQVDNQAAEVRDVATAAYPAAEVSNNLRRGAGEAQILEQEAASHSVPPTTNPAFGDRELAKADAEARRKDEFAGKASAKGSFDKMAATTQPAGGNGAALSVDGVAAAPNEAAAAPAPTSAPPAASASTTQVASAPVSTTAPSTGPVADQAIARLAPVTAPADEPVNVVIFVQPTDTPAAAGLPETRPSALPPTTQASPSTQSAK